MSLTPNMSLYLSLVESDFRVEVINGRHTEIRLKNYRNSESEK